MAVGSRSTTTAATGPSPGRSRRWGWSSRRGSGTSSRSATTRSARIGWVAVAGARRLDEAFERPDDFDLATFWAESSAAYERDAPRVEVTVRVREDRIGWLRRAVGGPTVDRAVRLPVEDPEDWQHLRLRIDWPDEVPAFLLSVGPGLEVLDPPDIRQQTIDLARATVAHYARFCRPGRAAGRLAAAPSAGHQPKRAGEGRRAGPAAAGRRRPRSRAGRA